MNEFEAALAGFTAGSNPKPPLSADQVARGMFRCYTNSLQLASDARLLTRAESLPRAVALAVLSLEELAKVPDLHDTFVAHELIGDSTAWPRFWKRFVRHGPKQQLMETYGRRTKAALARLHPDGESVFGLSHILDEGQLERLDTAKQRCLYVDYVEADFFSASEHVDELIPVLDGLLGLIDERHDAFASRHVSELRSASMISRTLVAARLASRASNLGEALEIRGRLEDLWIVDAEQSTPGEDAADFLTLFSRSTTDTIPDYLGSGGPGRRLIDSLGDKASITALTAVGKVLRARLDFDRLPTSSSRALRMLKIGTHLLMGAGLEQAAGGLWNDIPCREPDQL